MLVVSLGGIIQTAARIQLLLVNRFLDILQTRSSRVSSNEETLDTRIVGVHLFDSTLSAAM
jgi:hypothetical protein